MWEWEHQEGWVLKNWCFRIVILEKTLESPLDCQEIKPIIKEISPEYSLEGLMLKLKLQYFGHLMQRTDSLERPWCWERLKAGREGDNRGWDGWMAHHQIDGHEFQQASGVGDGQEAWHAAVHEITKSWTWLSNWTEYNYKWHTQSWWNVFEVTNSVRVK